MRALVVSNMRPDRGHPARGSFVRDQVAALRRLDDLDVELYEFEPGPAALLRAAVALRRRRERYDIVHAHFGLSAWPALGVRADARVLTLHGTDVRHPRTRRLTFAVAHRYRLVAAASAELAALAGASAVLPCGIALERFNPIPREQARLALGLDPGRPYLLFPADPARSVKRFDRARAVAGDTELLSLGRTEPGAVALAINAANAVLIPSDHEGFGLAALEALACDVPVLATPTGIHPLALADVPGTLCAPFDPAAWRAALAPHVAAADPRVDGRASAARFSAQAMAERVALAWRALA